MKTTEKLWRQYYSHVTTLLIGGREQKPNLLGKWYAFTRFFIERDENRRLTVKTLRDYWEKEEEHQPTDFVWEFQSENVLTTNFPEDDEETAIWEIDEETGLLF